MTLHELPDLIQGSDQWHDQRRGIITASVIGQLITPATIKPANNPASRALTIQLAAERITGWTDPTYMNDDMLRGVEDEPRAVAAYEKHTGADVTLTGFMVRTEPWGTLGFSPDGMVGNNGLIECKSRRPKKHLQTILDNAVPAENLAQCQAGLLVSGRDWIDYISFCGGMPLFIKRVEPDPKWFEAILRAVERFEVAVADIIARYERGVEGLPMTERVIEQGIVI